MLFVDQLVISLEDRLNSVYKALHYSLACMSDARLYQLLEFLLIFVSLLKSEESQSYEFLFVVAYRQTILLLGKLGVRLQD